MHRAPHHAVRYAPVVSRLRRLPPGSRVLEVGSGVEGLGAFWPGAFVGVDLAFDGPRAPNLRAVIADGVRLPFADRTFDLVVSVDVLTELPSHVLGPVCAEMARVARREVLVLAVTGPDAEAFDRDAAAGLRRSGRAVPPWLVQEIATGAPATETVAAALGAHGRLRVGSNTSIAWQRRLFRLEQALARLRLMTVLQSLVRAWGRRGARELPGLPAYRHRFLLEIQPTSSPPRADS